MPAKIQGNGAAGGRASAGAAESRVLAPLKSGLAHAIERRQEVVEADGLVEVLDTGRRAHGREHDDVDFAQLSPFVHGFEELPAAHDGHGEIEDDGLGPVPVHERERLSSVRGASYAIALRLERGGECVAHVLVVVNDEDAGVRSMHGELHEADGKGGCEEQATIQV
jgi:hypothetical protein